MAQKHPIWRGHLRLALVSCPVALYTAHKTSGDLHFHLINPKTQNRIRMVTLDAGTDKPVERGDLVKGYEFKKDTYVLLDDADFERAKIDTSDVLTVDKFVAADTVDPIYFDGSYYLVPDGKAGQDVYVVLRDAIAKAGRMALSRLVLARRERAVAILPMDRGLVLHTLHEERDLEDPKELFAEVPGGKPDQEMVRLATQLVDRQTGKYDPGDMEDRYEVRLREVIDAKLRGEEEAPEPEPEERRDNVIDLMAALKRSLGQTTDEGKRAPAKKGTPRPATRSKSPKSGKDGSTGAAKGSRAPIRKRA
ncbi:Ku protein [Muricoccus radiodurans]|uniref:non-homologous end joining protein Ku n=1 Tax=Muricoccus radiodurans TaxID=2231721 RepID=UPI003CF6AF15